MAPKKDDKKAAPKKGASSGGGKAKKKVRDTPSKPWRSRRRSFRKGMWRRGQRSEAAKRTAQGAIRIALSARCQIFWETVAVGIVALVQQRRHSCMDGVPCWVVAVWRRRRRPSALAAQHSVAGALSAAHRTVSTRLSPPPPDDVSRSLHPRRSGARERSRKSSRTLCSSTRLPMRRC